MRLKNLSKYDICEREGGLLVWSLRREEYCKPGKRRRDGQVRYALYDDRGALRYYSEGQLRYMLRNPGSADIPASAHFTPDGFLRNPKEAARTRRAKIELPEKYRAARYPSVDTYGGERERWFISVGLIRTARSYRQTVKRFISDMGSDMPLGSITRETLETWLAIMREKGLAVNTVNYYFRGLRALYNRALDDGKIKAPVRNPFDRLKVRTEATCKRALSVRQIHKLATMSLPDPRMERARDIWMLSFYLQGIAPVDLWKFRPGEIVSGTYSYRRTKTSSAIVIQIPPEATAIIERLEGESGFLNLPNREKVNRALNILGREIGLTFTLTLYCARHSWATAMQQVNAPISVISQGMGHASQETTRIYLAGIRTSETARWAQKAIKALNL